MRQSKLFTKTRKEAPKDEISKNASLLIRAGFIYKEMAGVYSYLPLGLKVLKNIENIVRKEMNDIGGQEILMTSLQDPEKWKKSDRWDDEKVDNWFKSELAGGQEVGIANTHEEPLVEILKNHLHSYSDLPSYIYQFQNKFRNEKRAKSGILRGREFIMKDLYSFSRTEEEFKEFYEKCAEAYKRIFDKAGIGHLTYRTVASGGSFTQGFTDEFQTVTSAGEDIIFVDEKKQLAINKEVYSDKGISDAGLNKKDLVEKKAIEVGNIFPLGTKYSEALGLYFTDEKGEKKPVIMGSYGIGLGRLMGTIAEVLSDENGLVWPASVSPFSVHIVRIDDEKETVEKADSLYKKLLDSNVLTLYDDRKGLRGGEKFADSDLMGMPFRVVVSKKNADLEDLEVKERKTGKTENINFNNLVKISQNG